MPEEINRQRPFFEKDDASVFIENILLYFYLVLPFSSEGHEILLDSGTMKAMLKGIDLIFFSFKIISTLVLKVKMAAFVFLIHQL